MRQTLFCFIIVVASISAASRAAERVVVAAYDFPPYFSAYQEQHIVGDLLQALNRRQSNYNFILEDVPSKARFRALSELGCCQMILFESPKWGWPQQLPSVTSGAVLVLGAERLVTVKKKNRDQRFFKRDDLRFGGLTGYHYPFLENRTDQGFLEDRYNVYLSLSHEVNIKMLLNGRLDVVMLHDEYLHQLRDQPWFGKLLLKHEPYDTYDLRALVNPAKGFTMEEWQAVLQPLIDDGTFAKILGNYGLPWPPEPLDVLVDTQA
ncbi:hypothetical protein ACQ5ES_06660 [Pseudidiomarina sp. E22-M8]|uniref:hypothetical protein n=1 Tax=Pseudidiomarina sp. E22-M8 TaxID=3424768 RepID=UPI00403CD6FA